MVIHPDGPPWDIFGLPRIITGEKSYARMREISASPANGIALCLGSLGTDPENDIAKIAKTYGAQIHYDAGFDGYIRPDHGRMIWGETGRPGYGLYDRALGAAYIAGLWEAIEKQ